MDHRLTELSAITAGFSASEKSMILTLWTNTAKDVREAVGKIKEQLLEIREEVKTPGKTPLPVTPRSRLQPRRCTTPPVFHRRCGPPASRGRGFNRGNANNTPRGGNNSGSRRGANRRGFNNTRFTNWSNSRNLGELGAPQNRTTSRNENPRQAQVLIYYNYQFFEKETYGKRLAIFTSFKRKLRQTLGESKVTIDKSKLSQLTPHRTGGGNQQAKDEGSLKDLGH